MPHVTKIPRKPKSSGCELKAAADVVSMIMLRLEIQEGKEAMRLKKFMNDYPHHVAVTLRLVEPWFRTGRIIKADSAFSSFLTAIALLKFGLFFIGIVKTATKCFPIKFLKAYESTNPARGDIKLLTTNAIIDGALKIVMAVGWMTKMMKFFVATVGTTMEGKPHSVELTRKVLKDGKFITEHYTKTTVRPDIVAELFNGFSVIDVADHYRQGILHIEAAWKTKTWWHRIFATILGIIVTDCYFAYCLEYETLRLDEDGNEPPDYFDFCDELCADLIFNPMMMRTQRVHADGADIDIDRPDMSSASAVAVEHMLVANSEHRIWRSRQEKSKNPDCYRPRAYCGICRNPCSYYCNGCGNPDEGKFVCFCGSATGRPCFYEHLSGVLSKFSP
jgi:hypothetical protein